ncbi:hypothetical protein GQ53DRAFT_430872 [Thozetella sp. PMI_491]|nr:hypothetical protein GQ53DRAFT_430872 [Thozetella sp. PMI_491]
MSLSTMSGLTRRAHIQDFSNVTGGLEPHWGYADRIVPCTNDAGSCAYLDVVYESHDIGMLYSGIFWATIGGILLLWAIARRVFPPREDDLVAEAAGEPVAKSNGIISRSLSAGGAAVRSYLLPRASKPIFGHANRLQVLVLVIMTAYLTIWTFAGIVYATWITPIKNQPASVYNTRTSLGPWSDRIGILAYALTPLSILLASRESLLSMLTGIPYTSFIFLHRWTGYLIIVQSILHTIAWVIVEARLYQPQPTTWTSFVAQIYIVWGFVALGLLVLLWFFSLPWTIRNVTGYEFFRKFHYIIAAVYIGALIGHWQQLQCFLVPGLVLWFCDRLARLIRMGMLHYGYANKDGVWGFAPARAEAQYWRDDRHGDVVRLDFGHVQAPWKIGQHFFLCFPDSSLWQSHPFTPLSLPVAGAGGKVQHSYIIRAKGGETKKIAKVIAQKLADATSEKAASGLPTTSIIMQGPYGESIIEGLTRDVNVLCVAGGTGIAYVLPVLLDLVREKANSNRKIELVWAVRREQDLEWVKPELDELRRAAYGVEVDIRVFVTDDAAGAKSSGSSVNEPVSAKETAVAEVRDSIAPLSKASSGRSTGLRITEYRRPDISRAVREFTDGVAHGSTTVFGSGPPGMIEDLRTAVASCNSAARVWKGEDRFDVRLVCDDRLEG